LDLARPRDPEGDGRRGLARAAAQLPQGDRRHLDVEVDAIEERSRDPRAIALDHGRRTAAEAAGVSEMPAGAGVERADETEAGGKGQPGAGPDDGDEALFERLAERLESVAAELRQLVQEEHAVVRQARLPRPRGGSSSDHADRARSRVRAAERTLEKQAGRRLVGGERPDLRHLDRLGRRERRKQPWQTAREHRLTGAWRAEEEEVVAARGG